VVVELGRPAFPMCLDFLPGGELLLVDSSERRLLRGPDRGSAEVHADLSLLSSKPWNDIVVDGRGNAYVNNTGFDFPGGEFAPGSIALVTMSGSVRQVADGLAFPNGMAVTADNATLIVAESYAEQLTAFTIDADGSLRDRRRWAPTPGDHPDGICLDLAGGAWYADVGNRRCVRVAEGGEVLDTVQLDRGCFSCALGGVDGRTLFIVAQRYDGAPGPPSGQLLAVDVSVPGAGWA
jgi:sugar lactone lactonase YvrE